MDINTTKEIAVSSALNFYSGLENIVPVKYRVFINLGFYIIFIAIYSVFVWKFYRFLARRDILKLDLNKYNNSTHPIFSKSLEVIFFCIEFLIVFPIIIFFWFGVLSLFLLFLSKSKDIGQIILISAGIVGAIRLTAYVSEDLSKDLAKMIPFTLLGIFIIDSNFFSVEDFIQKISQIPSFISNIFLYLLFIFVAETIIRLIFTSIIAIKGRDLE